MWAASVGNLEDREGNLAMEICIFPQVSLPVTTNSLIGLSERNAGTLGRRGKVVDLLLLLLLLLFLACSGPIQREGVSLGGSRK